MKHPRRSRTIGRRDFIKSGALEASSDIGHSRSTSGRHCKMPAPVRRAGCATSFVS
jgi:hypothetical protein